MKKLILILFSVGAFAQAPNIQWQKCFGNTGGDIFYSVLQTVDGGYLFSGDTSSGNFDAWLVKTDALGNVQWQRTYGGSGGDGFSYIEPTADGGYMITGASGSTDGDLLGVANHGASDSWFLKIDALGNILWQKRYGGSGTDGLSFSKTNDGGYIAIGYTNSNDGDVSGFHGGINFDIWVVKLDTSRNIVWQKCYGGSDEDDAGSILQTADGGYIFNATVRSSDGDVVGNHGASDSWLVKINSTGTIQWQKCFGSSAENSTSSILNTADSGYILGGHTNDNSVPGHHNNYPYDDVWLIKIDNLGNMQWQKCYGGSNNDYGYPIPTADGGYIIAGYTESNNGDVTNNHGGTDIWSFKINSTGTLQWQKTFGGSGYDRLSQFLQTADGGYILAGATYSDDGDVSGNHGGRDAWVVKLGPELTTAGFETGGFGLFPNPVQTVLNIENTNNEIINSVVVSDILGKAVYQINENVTHINVSSLPKAVYFAKIITDNGIFVGKVFKN